MGFVRNFGVTELIIILVIVMIIFGVGRLTEIGSALGRSIKEFRSASEDDVTQEPENDSTKPQVGSGNQ
jgi:sec-independent protein translocase protein TatA